MERVFSIEYTSLQDLAKGSLKVEETLQEFTKKDEYFILETFSKNDKYYLIVTVWNLKD